MKRFTETNKWDDPWFRKLSPEIKLLWQWLLDRCDNAGIIDPDIELASFQIGYQYPMDTLSKLGDRVVRLECGKWFIPKFVPFQIGKLSADCRAHGPAFQSLLKHSIDPETFQFKGYPKGIHTLQEKEKEKEEDKDKEKSPKKSRGTLEEIKAFAVEIGMPESDGECCFHKWEGNGWTNNKVPIKDWKATIRSWKAGKYLPSQKNAPQKSNGDFVPLFPGHRPDK